MYLQWHPSLRYYPHPLPLPDPPDPLPLLNSLPNTFTREFRVPSNGATETRSPTTLPFISRPHKHCKRRQLEETSETRKESKRGTALTHIRQSSKWLTAGVIINMDQYALRLCYAKKELGVLRI